jgi:hypothetical protein
VNDRAVEALSTAPRLCYTPAPMPGLLETQQENAMSRTTALGLASLLTLWVLAPADLAAILLAPP